MQFFLFAVLLAAVPVTKVLADFQSSHSDADSQMSILSASIGAIKSIADNLGHTEVSQRCDEASEHLARAQGSWGGISDFASKPWLASSSSGGLTVKSSLSACGETLQNIYQMPQCQHASYSQPISRCNTHYNGCQSACTIIFDWPPLPTPSGGFSGYTRLRRRSEALCPVGETACPISKRTGGFECLDTRTEITSCGGCVTKGEGEDCMSIPGARGVGCSDGKCVVFSVMPGYVMGEQNRPRLA